MRQNALLLMFLLVVSCAWSQPYNKESGNRTNFSRRNLMPSGGCDKDIRPDDNRTIAYRKRDNRCEGFYRSEVTANPIDVVSLMKGRLRFKLDKNEVIEVSSPFIRNRPVHVRAVGIPIKTYYRMDAELDPGGKLVWPVGEVIYQKRLHAEKIGVFGSVMNQKKEIYVPVSTAAKLAKNAANDEMIRLCLRIAADVEIVKWRYAAVINDLPGQSGNWQDVGKRRYRIGRPICVTLPQQTKTGELFVEIAAREKNRTEFRLRKEVRLIVKEPEGARK